MSFFEPVFAFKLWEQGFNLWLKGGWAMIPLGLTAFILYSKAAQIRVEISKKKFTKKKWYVKEGEDETGDKSAQVARTYLRSRGVDITKDSSPSIVRSSFDELRARELPQIDRNLRFLKVAMSAAPLWGLLGTVTGMLSTFAGLSQGTGDNTQDSIAGGISEALITTQTGLMIALPGLFFYFWLRGMRDRYNAFLARLESGYARFFMHQGVSP
ncbi:MAG: MotA/TolQ/ExbB proton channel family protein [Verrucomicrobiota bacterium]